MTTEQERPDVQRVTCAEDLKNLKFFNEMAAVEVPIELLDALPLKNDSRCDSDRLGRVEKQIRKDGYDNLTPVVAHIGRKGRWVVIDGGHRLTAARRIADEFFANLFWKKVRSIYFLIHRTPLSNKLVDVA